MFQVMADEASMHCFIELLKQNHRAQLVQIYRSRELKYGEVTLPESLDWQAGSAAPVLRHCVVFL